MSVSSLSGSYVARVLYQEEFLNENLAQVIVRPAWSPLWNVAFVGGSYNEQANLDPKLTWIDDSDLVIDYASNSEYEPRCESRVGKISVICKSHRR